MLGMFAKFVRTGSVIGAAAALMAITPASFGSVLSGSVSNWAGYDGAPAELGNEGIIASALIIGDDEHQVSILWSFATFDWPPEYGGPAFSAWFYANDLSLLGGTHNAMDVAWADGITDVSQITDASRLKFQELPMGNWLLAHDHMFADAQSNSHGVGDFMVVRSRDSGHYGVLRVDHIHSFSTEGRPYAHMDATWWFQTDGTGDFSSVPSPSALIGLLAGCGVLGARRRRN